MNPQRLNRLIGRQPVAVPCTRESDEDGRQGTEKDYRHLESETNPAPPDLGHALRQRGEPFPQDVESLVSQRGRGDGLRNCRPALVRRWWR